MDSGITLKGAVIFAILMEGDGGILNKSPSYIKEKLRICQTMNTNDLESILDVSNQMKLHKWEQIWKGGKKWESIG